MANFPEALPLRVPSLGASDHMRDDPPRSAVHSWLASADQETEVSAPNAADGNATSSSCVSASGWDEHSARATTAGGFAISFKRAFFSRFSFSAFSASSFSFASFAAFAASAFLLSLLERLSFPGLETFPESSPDGSFPFFFESPSASSSSSELASGAENFHTTSSPWEVPAASTCARPDFAVAMEVTAPFFTSIVVR